MRGGFGHKEGDENFSYKMNNAKLHRLCGTTDLSHFIKDQQCNYAAHIVRTANDRSAKKLMFSSDKNLKAGNTTATPLEQAAKNKNTTVDGSCNYALAKGWKSDAT